MDGSLFWSSGWNSALRTIRTELFPGTYMCMSRLSLSMSMRREYCERGSTFFLLQISMRISKSTRLAFVRPDFRIQLLSLVLKEVLGWRIDAGGREAIPGPFDVVNSLVQEVNPQISGEKQYTSTRPMLLHQCIDQSVASLSTARRRECGDSWPHHLLAWLIQDMLATIITANSANTISLVW